MQVLKLAEKAGLAKLGHVALDGTKIKANASKHNAMSYDRMKTRETELAPKWIAGLKLRKPPTPKRINSTAQAGAVTKCPAGTRGPHESRSSFGGWLLTLPAPDF